jgi:hypothetical protein
VAFRDLLLATLRAARPVLSSPGILVVGSEVPNLLEPGAAATLVVSQDLDIGVPVDRHRELKPRLDELRDFSPFAEEASVWLPRSRELLELNFVGMDPGQDPAEAERRVTAHDAELKAVSVALRRLIEPPSKPRRQIGF